MVDFNWECHAFNVSSVLWKDMFSMFTFEMLLVITGIIIIIMTKEQPPNWKMRSSSGISWLQCNAPLQVIKGSHAFFISLPKSPDWCGAQVIVPVEGRT